MNSTFLIGLAAVAALFLLHRLALWMEERGWIYYRTKRSPHGAGSLAAMEVASLLEPELEHVIEEVRSAKVRAEDEESGKGY